MITLRPETRRGMGLVAIGWYAFYASLDGNLHDYLWSCLLGIGLLGAGLVAARRELVAGATLWLLLGNVLWGIDACTARVSGPLTIVTHVGGLALGLFSVAALGMPRRRVWSWTTLALMALQQLCRWVTPEAANVNLAFHVHPGWEEAFPSYALYWGVIGGGGALGFALCEEALRRVVGVERTDAPAATAPVPQTADAAGGSA